MSHFIHVYSGDSSGLEPWHSNRKG